MSKETKNSQIAGPLIVGGLMLAAGLYAVAQVRRRARGCETVDTIVQTCEHALAKLVERVAPAAAA